MKRMTKFAIGLSLAGLMAVSAGDVAQSRTDEDLANIVAFGGTKGCRAGHGGNHGFRDKKKDAIIGREELGGTVLNDALVKIKYELGTESIDASLGCNLFGGEVSGGVMWSPKDTLDKRINSISLGGNQLGLPGPLPGGTGFVVGAGFSDISNFYYKSEMYSVGSNIGWNKAFVAGDGPFGPTVVTLGAWAYYGHSNIDTWVMGRTNGFTSDFGYRNEVEDDRYGFGVRIGLDGVLEDTQTPLGRFLLIHYSYYSGGLMIHDVDAKSTLSFTGQPSISNSVSDTKTSFVGHLATGLRATFADKVTVQAGVAVGYESDYPMMALDPQEGLVIDDSEVWDVRVQLSFKYQF